MKKTIIAVWGNANTGKSTTIKMIYRMFFEMYSNVTILNEGPISTVDITKIFSVEGHKIGIESQGDPNSNIFNSLKLFNKEKCELIICATRTKGNTVKEVMIYESDYGYDVVWLSNLFSGQKDTKDLNNRTATFIHTVIADILKGIL